MSASPEFKPGDHVPGTKYRVVKQIGAGGMGIVYQVVKPPEIQGVLKLMSDELARHDEFRIRFFDEVRVLAQLDHPNIVKVFDYDSLEDGTPFYVMELLHGRTVRDVISTMGTVPPRVAFEVTRQLLEALHCAHTHEISVVHRDIKPENIFLHAPRHGEPVVKLIDFGVVAFADEIHDGTFVGTWKYAAPEQIRGERALPATDLYAVGLVLYEMLAGIGPFEGIETGPLLAEAHLRAPPPLVTNFAPWVPKSIVALITSALSKDPKDRPKDAYAFAERLYELEWANAGTDAREHTSEGPLSRVLSSVDVGRLSSKNLAAAKPASDRLGDVPLIGIPPSKLHHGPTIKGVGQQEATSPGEDALLDGLVERGEVKPLAKKARDIDASPRPGQVVIRPSGPDVVAIDKMPSAPKVRSAPTIDAPPSDPHAFATEDRATKIVGSKPRRFGAVIAIAIAAALGIAGILFLRRHAPAPEAARSVIAPPPTTSISAAPLEVTSVASSATTEPPTTHPPVKPSAHPRPTAAPVAAPPQATTARPANSSAPGYIRTL